MTSIITPYGRLIPSPRSAAEWGAGTPASPSQDGYAGTAQTQPTGPLPKAGNEIYAFDALTPHMDYTCVEQFLEEPLVDNPQVKADVLNMARKAERNHAASVSVRPHWVQFLQAETKGSPLKISSMIGLPNMKYQPKGLVPTATKVEQIANGVLHGADEFEAMADLPNLKKGNLDAVQADIQAMVKAAEGRPLKVILETGELSDDQIRSGAKAAEAAGASFVSTASGFGSKARPGAEEILRDACSLGIKSCAQSLTDCQKISAEMGPKRRLRFAAFHPGKTEYQDTKAVRSKVDQNSQSLTAELNSPDGLKARAEVEEWRKKLLDRIEQAHAKGIPVVYLSVCIRPNDATTYDENVAIHNRLLEQTRQAGLAYVDPFEMEGSELFKNPNLSPRVIQELLMDADAGLWPNVLSQCDAISHGDYWKESVGAREEHLMAQAWGIPSWNGGGLVRLRQAPEMEQSGPLEMEAHLAPVRRPR